MKQNNQVSCSGDANRCMFVQLLVQLSFFLVFNFFFNLSFFLKFENTFIFQMLRSSFLTFPFMISFWNSLTSLRLRNNCHPCLCLYATVSHHSMVIRQHPYALTCYYSHIFRLSSQHLPHHLQFTCYGFMTMCSHNTRGHIILSSLHPLVYNSVIISISTHTVLCIDMLW